MDLFKGMQSQVSCNVSIVYRKCTLMDAIRRPFSIQSQPLKGPASSFVKRPGSDRPE